MAICSLNPPGNLAIVSRLALYESSTRRANVKRTGHHASNFAWRLQLGSFYVLATLSCGSRPPQLSRHAQLKHSTRMSTASTVAAGLRAARSPAVAAPGRRVQAHRNLLRPPLNLASTSTEAFACIGLLAMIQACRPGRVSPPPPRRPLWTSLRSLPIPTVGKGSGKFPCQRDLASATHASTALLKFISPPGDAPVCPRCLADRRSASELRL